MTKHSPFIKVTTNTDLAVYVYASSITMVHQSPEDSTLTTIYLAKDEFFTVKETPEEVLVMIDEATGW